MTAEFAQRQIKDFQCSTKQAPKQSVTVRENLVSIFWTQNVAPKSEECYETYIENWNELVFACLGELEIVRSLL